MGQQRAPRSDQATNILARKVRELEARLKQVEAQRSPTVPRYDLSIVTENSPLIANEGQVAQDVETPKTYHYWRGQWYKMGADVSNGPWYYVGGGDTIPGYVVAGHTIPDIDEPDFENGWDNTSGYLATRFRLNALYELELDIAVEGGDVETVVFTIPGDFPLEGSREFVVSDGYGGYADVHIAAGTGEVYWAVP